MADRRVRYQIDVESKADAVKHAEKATRGLGEEAHKAGKHVHALGEDVKKADGLMGRMARQALLHAEGLRTFGLAAHEAHAKLGEFLEFVGAEAAVEALKEIAERVADIGKEAVVSAGKAQRMNRIIDIFSGGREGGNENREFLEGFASGGKGFTGTEINEEQAEGAFVDLRKLGMEEGQAKLAMKAAADLAAVSRNKDEAFNEAIAAFQHVESMGKISARQLMPLGIGVKDFRTLDQFKGKSDKAIRKAMEEGKVDKTDLFKLIMSRASETKIGQRAADNADLLSTKLAKMSELPERFYKKLANSAAVDQLSHSLDTMLSKLDPDGPVGRRIFGALEKAFGGLGDLVDGIDWGAVGDNIAKALDMVKPTLEAVEHLAMGAWTAFKGWAKAIETVSEMLPGMGVDAKSVPKTKAEVDLDAKYARQRDQLRQMRARMAGVPGAEGTLDSLHAAGAAIPAGLAQGVKDHAAKANAAVGDMADAMVDTVRKKHKTHSPSEVFSDIAAFDVAGYVNEIARSKSAIAAAANEAFGVPSGGAAAGGGGRIGGGGDMNIGPITVQIMGGAGGEAAGNAAADAFEKRLDAWAARWVGRMRAARGA